MIVNLDELRQEVLAWLNRLWEDNGQSGSFRVTATSPPCLMSATDVAWIAHCLDVMPELESKRRAWLAWLQGKQLPGTGEFLHDQPNCHKRGHAFWQTARALNILGGQMLAFPEYLRPVLDIRGIREWFAVNSDCHQTLGLIPVLVSLNDPEWADAFFAEIAKKQDPETGLWPRDGGELGHSFAFTALHNAAGKRPAQVEKILDYALQVETDNLSGNTPFGADGKRPGFKTMDTVYLIERLSRQLGRRRDESLAILNRLADCFVPCFLSYWEGDGGRPDTHGLLANVHTFGLLSEALPDRFPSTRAWRFDWDKAEMYYCQPIADWGEQGRQTGGE